VEETVSMTNVTVTGNTAESGAGLNDQGEGITLVNVTVANNMVTADNQPNNLRSSHQGFYNLTNTLIADSTVSAAGATNTKNCLVTINSSLNSLDSDGTCELDELNGDIIGVNPLLGPLQDNGGATHTHALLQGSPAIDAGDWHGAIAQRDSDAVTVTDTYAVPHAHTAAGVRRNLGRQRLLRRTEPDRLTPDAAIRCRAKRKHRYLSGNG
jgi:hypothetical protein